MENNFTNTIKEFIIDQLENWKGVNLQVYTPDLGCILTEEIKVNSSVHGSAYKAKEFIKENFEVIGDLIELTQNEYATTLNPFLEPEKVEVWAYVEGTEFLLSQLEVLQEMGENEITLTDELIDKIIEELESKEFEIIF